MGTAARDFHNFNMAFRQGPGTEVVAFTAAQSAGIDGRRYPPSLAGELYWALSTESRAPRIPLLP
jgi:predicted GTPase